MKNTFSKQIIMFHLNRNPIFTRKINVDVMLINISNSKVPLTIIAQGPNWFSTAI